MNNVAATCGVGILKLLIDIVSCRFDQFGYVKQFFYTLFDSSFTFNAQIKRNDIIINL